MIFNFFSAKRMRKSAEKRIRRSRRESFMELYKELKDKIKISAKRGNKKFEFFVSPYNFEQMLLWRFFRRKHKDFKVVAHIHETNGGFTPKDEKEASSITKYKIEITW